MADNSGWLAAEMPDLNTESPRVIQALHQWISTMVRHFEIDFLRIDTVKHVRKSFWPDFVAAAGVPAMGEVLHGGEWFGTVTSDGHHWLGFLNCTTVQLI